MKIPFAEEPPGLPDNRLMADQRLRSLGRRLGKNPALHDVYKAEIQNLIDQGYAERVPDEDMQGNQEGHSIYHIIM